MIAYVVATIITISFAYFERHYKAFRTNRLFWKRFFQFLSALPLFFIAALRYNVGTDYPFTYTQRFLWRLNGYDLNNIFEFGFVKLIDFIQLFTREPQYLFIICAFLFSTFIAIAIYEQSDNYVLSFLVLVIGGHYFAYLNLMRNYVALAIVLYAFKYIEKRKIKVFTAWIIIAASIHTSALLFIPLYFIYHCKVNKWIVIGIIGGVAGIGLPIIDTLARYLVNFTNYSWYYNVRNTNIVPQITYIVINIVIITIQLFSYNKMKNDLKFQLHFKLEMTITVIALSSYVVPMVRRLILVPMITQILIVPYISKYKINTILKWCLLFVLVILFILTTYRQIVILEMHKVLPYKTIF